MSALCLGGIRLRFIGHQIVLPEREIKIVRAKWPSPRQAGLDQRSEMCALAEGSNVRAVKDGEARQ